MAAASWTAFHEARERWPDVVTTDSRPIAWFGDSRRYATSPVKVVTAGLNPSQIEFPVSAPESRFPAGAGEVGASASYQQSLDDYFHVDPYWAWFNTFRCVLAGVGAGFAPGAGLSTALHTDLGSPVATSPTWSKLGPSPRKGLAERGIGLWHELITELQPHVVLLSVAKKHLETIAFPALSEWEPLCYFPLPGGGTYTALIRWFEISDRPTAVVWGQAAVTPFQLIPQLARHELGHQTRIALTRPPARGA